MPYTKTPTTDTYSQENITLAREIVSRQNDPLGSKDEDLLNNILEINKDRRTGDQRTYNVKRAGSEVFLALGGELRGSYMWKDKNLFVYCVGQNVYLYNVTTEITTTCSAVFSTSSGDVGFDLFLYDVGTSDIVATDGTKLVTITSTGTVTASTSVDLPTPHLPKCLFLDGYLFLVETNTAALWNSDLNTPLNFTAGSFILTEIEGDNILDFSRLNNYIVAFGNNTIEYFYDAAEETGSPLRRNDTPVKLNGYIGGLSRAGNVLYFIGYNEFNQPDIFKLADFTIEAISSESVRRYINSCGLAPTQYFTGHTISNMGHDFYIFNGYNRCFAYDIKEKLWARWSWQNNNYFRFLKTNSIISFDGVFPCFTIVGDNNLYVFKETLYQDSGVNFSWLGITEPSDFGTMNRKTMGKVTLICDRPTASSKMIVYVSDDDFQSWYGGWQVELNQDSPHITRLGSFRQRAFKLLYTDNFPMRVQYIQVQINKGRN